jgi:hypothetical protein
MQQWLFWAPRIMGILFMVWVSIFALDVFAEGNAFWRTIIALFVHLIPTLIVLTALVIAWRWEAVGAILFITLGGWYLMTWPHMHWSAYLVISGPLFLVGGLFLTDWAYRAKLHRSS